MDKLQVEQEMDVIVQETNKGVLSSFCSGVCCK